MEIQGKNLKQWKASGEPQRWVERHNYSWNHDDWLSLLNSLEKSDYWPINADDVGAVLEDLKRRGRVAPLEGSANFPGLVRAGVAAPADPRFLLEGLDLSPSRKGLVTIAECERALGVLRKDDGLLVKYNNQLILNFDGNQILHDVNVSATLKTLFLALDAPSPHEEWDRLGFFPIREDRMGWHYYCDGCSILARHDGAVLSEIYYYIPDRSIEGTRTREHNSVRSFGAKCPPETRMVALDSCLEDCKQEYCNI
jgi:hypothetical protein